MMKPELTAPQPELMPIKPELIVALDNCDDRQAEELAESLSSAGVQWFKIGLELFTAFGPDLVRRFKDKGRKVFLDLKLHDIPNTVGNAARSAAFLGADLLTVHCSGGGSMLAAALQGVEGTKTRILGITVLTSLSDEDLAGVAAAPRKESVARLFERARMANLHGIVCSPNDLADLRGAGLTRGFLWVTPGIRPLHSQKNDQKNVAAPAFAVRSGATHLVVGRPITAAPGLSPAAAAEKMLAEMEGAF